MFRIGDRVVTNQNAFKALEGPEGEKHRGVKGTIQNRGSAFDWDVRIDDPVDGIETQDWLVNSDEIDKLED